MIINWIPLLVLIDSWYTVSENTIELIQNWTTMTGEKTKLTSSANLSKIIEIVFG